MLIWMRKRLVKYAIPVVGLLSLAGYLFFVNPLLVGSLNLREFDRAELNRQAREIASSLLGDDNEYNIKESIGADLDLLNNIQRSVGLRSESEIISSNLPVQMYSADFYLKKGTPKVELKSDSPVLSIRIDAHGRVASLSYTDINDSDGRPVTATEAGGKIKTLAPLLSLDPLALRQVRPQDIEKDDWINIEKQDREEKNKEAGLVRAEQEFFFNEKIEGVPLASYSHSFSFTGNEIRYVRSLLFKNSLYNRGGTGVAGFLSIVIWFAIGMLALTIFGLKIRRDEIDWSHYIRFSSFAAILTFTYFLFNEGRFSLLYILGSMLAGFFIGFALGLIFAVAESKTRENNSGTLAVQDAIFSGNFKIRELGETIFWSLSYGSVFFLVPLAALAVSAMNEKFRLALWTANPAGIGGFIPASALLQSFIHPALWAFLFSSPIFGILACLICQRFPGKRGSMAVAAVFAFLGLAALDAAPALVWLALLFAAGILLCGLWRDYGFTGVLFSLLFYLSIQRAFLLFMAKDAIFAFAGLALILFWLLVLGIAVYLVFKGKPVAKMKPYEPKYLKRMKEKERFERELEIAKHLQERLLPKKTPHLEKFEIASLCEPANEVGGDYFDFLSLGDNRMLVFLGDVSGKGIRAAFYMTLAKGLLHGSFNLCKDHLELLTLLNRRFGGLSEEGVFLTLITLTLDTESGEVLLSSAGHNPPLLFKKDTVWSVPSRGLVIGPMPDDILARSLKDFKFRMEEGDVLLLYTDGITEAMNHHLDEYGTERLKKVFEESVQKSAGEIVNSIRKSVLDFTQGYQQSDDLTILVLKAKKGGD